jgi:hypothetical protein
MERGSDRCVPELGDWWGKLPRKPAVNWIGTRHSILLFVDMFPN